MQRKSSPRDRMVAELAGRQHGVFAAWQLTGFTEAMVRWRLDTGRWFKVQPSVYSLTPRVLPRGRMLAAALTFGPEAVLSHRAAAAVWDIGPWPRGLIDVTVPVKRKRRANVRLHRAQVERVVRDGFPVTTAARTLIDQASHLEIGRLRDLFERAERLGLLDVDSVNEQVQGRRGARNIRAILVEWHGPEPTRSALEDEFRALCRDARLPLPSFNVHLHGHEVDAYWPDHNVVVELDGWEWHKTRAAFERDRRRDADLTRAGERVVRFSARQVRARTAVVDVLRSVCPTAAGRGRAPPPAGARRTSAP